MAQKRPSMCILTGQRDKQGTPGGQLSMFSGGRLNPLIRHIQILNVQTNPRSQVKQRILGYWLLPALSSGNHTANHGKTAVLRSDLYSKRTSEHFTKSSISPNTWNSYTYV